MPKPLISVFGANPAWQKTLYFGEFRRGQVNRAEKLELYAGGKGVNFCRAAKCFGEKNHIIVKKFVFFPIAFTGNGSIISE